MLMRFFKSFASAIFIPMVLFLVGSSAEHSDVDWIQRAAIIPFEAVVWPLFLTSPLFPPPPSCPSCHPTRAAILAAILIDFVSYFVLTYLALWLLARRQPALPQVIELKYEREA